MIKFKYIISIIFLTLSMHLVYSEKTPVAVHVTGKLDPNDIGKKHGKRNPAAYCIYLLNILNKDYGEPESDLDRLGFYNAGKREDCEIVRIAIKWHKTAVVKKKNPEVIIYEDSVNLKDQKKKVRICRDLTLSISLYNKIKSFSKDGKKFSLEEAADNSEIYTIPLT